MRHLRFAVAPSSGGWALGDRARARRRCPLETLQTALWRQRAPQSTLHWLVQQKLLTVEGAEKRVVRDKQLEYASLAVSLEEAQEEIRRP